MNTLLAIYAAVIFIAGVIFFTIGELNKNKEDESETFKWMRVLAIIGIILAIACAIAARNMA
ncbi:hypothetical protein [Butyrivibrio sp. AE2032]|jgi:hypothetical protein|uniref:hypothetical protein n=1 Tax=Butyrivibrio sp. AE2032 TaxID=1458463 RepID=UPI0005572934|nr:hypothetical protein [Butyrivibrio sp. AE2032]